MKCIEKFLKPASLVLAAGICCSSAFALDFSVKVLPAVNVPFTENFKSTVNGTAALDAGIFTIRGRDSLYASLQGSIYPVQPGNLDSINIYEGQLSAGYDFRIIDRLSVGLEGGVGIWYIPENKDKGWETISGLVYSGRSYINFYALPELTAGVFAGYKQYAYNPEPFTSKVELGLSLRYNFNQGLFSKGDVKIESEKTELQAIFPVFYSRYDDHSFGSVTFVNNGRNDITDVRVSVYMEKYMSTPSLCSSFDRIKRGEEFTSDLTAFLNEGILNNIMASRSEAEIIVEYRSLGKKCRYETSASMSVVGRNSMTWEDDRRAAAFVSRHDATAMLFARRIKSAVNQNLSASVPVNLQYAEAVSKVLKAYGLNYVIDPSSAFTDNFGSAAVDFLQYPYQTLVYHGGDCDDLSILNCALLEAMGVQTAFITVPGHIFIAFDAGVSPENAKSVGQYIIQEDKVWIPLEITLCQDTFEMERNIGAHEWNKFPEERKLIPLSYAWQEYPAVGIPDSEVSVSLPDIDKIIGSGNSKSSR